MNELSGTFVERWQSGFHVGAARPTGFAFIRTGKFDRRYDEWPGPQVGAEIGGESTDKPWQAFWTPTSAWALLPNMFSAGEDQDFEQNGITTNKIVIENILYREQAGNLGALYHMIERGSLAPYRGYHAPGRPVPTVSQNEWFTKLIRNAQVAVFGAYGGDGGEGIVCTYTGLIDDVDMTSRPDRITLTTRDFGGQTLVDQSVFGEVKSKSLPEPVVFVQKGTAASADPTEAVGYAADGSSNFHGHPSRFVLDKDPNTQWWSENRGNPNVTEWIEIHLPKGKYKHFAINVTYPGMEMFAGIFARNIGMSGDSCQMDGVNIPNGWVTRPGGPVGGQPEGFPDAGGIVPGGHGGWPYIKRWSTAPEGGQSPTLGAEFELGTDSVLRIGFRRLKLRGRDQYRAGVGRLVAGKKKGTPVATQRVGRNADASSSYQGNASKNGPRFALDKDRKTEWRSEYHGAPNVTEWIEIHVPAGRYDSISLEIPKAGMEMFVGIFARSDKLGGRACRFNDADIANGWQVAPGGNPEGGQPDGFPAAGGVVPGGHGGWSYLVRYVNVPASDKSQGFSLNGKWELGDNSVIRLGFRNLPGGGDKRAAIVTRFHAVTRTGVKQPERKPESKVVVVKDPSDIVRVVLRWAGFKEWEVEDTGAKLEGKWVFNRQHKLIDIIKKLQDATGFVFFMRPPIGLDPLGDSHHLGVPVFREGRIVRDDLPNVPNVTDRGLLTGIQVKLTDEPLASEVTVRGKPATRQEGGVTFGADTATKLQVRYRPPWTRNGRTAGIKRHMTHDEPRLTSKAQVEIYALLVALRMALASSQATIEIPGTVQFDIDDQIGLIDEGTGLNTRLYIARRSSAIQTGTNASWKTTLAGTLIDTPDVIEIKEDIRAVFARHGRATGRISLTDEFAGL